MRDDEKSKSQLIEELQHLRARLEALTNSPAHSNVNGIERLTDLSPNILQAFNAIKAGIVIKNAEGVIVFANRMAYQLLGQPSDNIVGNTSNDPVWKMIDEDGRPVSGDNHPSVVTLRSGKPISDAVRGLFSDDEKQARWVLINTQPIFDSQTGTIREVITTFVDITRQKRAEQELQSSTLRFETIFRRAPLMMSISTIEDGTFLAVNDEFLDYSGFDGSEIIGKRSTDLALMTTDAREKIVESLKANGRVSGETIELLDKNGNTRFVIFNAEPITIDDQPCMLTLALDITERRETEQALIESESRYRELFTHQPAAFALHEIICDENGKPVNYRFLEANPSFERLTGLKAEDIIGKTVLDIMPNTEQYWIETYGDVALTGKTRLLENYAAELDRYYSVLAYSPQIGQFAVFFMDVTNQAKAKQIVEASEERLSLAIEAANDGLWDWDIEENNTYFSPKYYTMLGYDPGEFPASFSGWESLLHPDDAERTKDTINKHLENGEPFQIEFRMLRKDGLWQWLMTKGKAVAWNDNGKPTRMLGTHIDISDRKLAEEALVKSEADLNEAQRIAKVGSWSYDIATDRAVWSRQCFEIFELDPDSSVPGWKQHRALFHPEDWQKLDAAVGNAMHTGDPYREQFRILLPSGKTRWGEVIGNSRFDKNGKLIELYGTIQDIDELKTSEEERARLQEQLMQVQKLESIGRLAGGVAHDFNNLLTGIRGNVAMAMMDMDNHNPMQETLTEIDAAAKRAANLTRQLLAFSRKQIIEPKTIAANELLEELKKLLQRIIGEDIQMIWNLAPDCGKIRVDPGQIDQVIINMAANARDAMPAGGKLEISTSNTQIVENDDQDSPDIPLGDYVKITVKDSGEGMDAETLTHVFEPFFTTKKDDEGTGLGLATAFGIIKQHNGHISVTSTRNVGTTFSILLPGIDSPYAEKLRRPNSKPVPKGTETILVVEDDRLVRNIAIKILERQGYNILHAEGGKAALDLIKADGQKIDLLLTDIVMPKMNGRDLALKLLEFYPTMKVLYTSGYTEDVIVKHGVLEEGLQFLAKPYTPQVLAQRIRLLLDNADV